MRESPSGPDDVSKVLAWQAGIFRDAEHEIEILNRHPGGAFTEIVEPRH